MHSLIALLYLQLFSSTALRLHQHEGPNIPSTRDSDTISDKGVDMAMDYMGATETESYQFIAEHGVAICACAKCGSTSLWHFIYKHLFGKDWEYEGPPWIQTTDSSRWQQKVTRISSDQLANVTKYALLRDPRKRLISSWKSKVSCDSSTWGTSEKYRNLVVPEIRRLAGQDYKQCMDLEEFLTTLNIIHQKGKARELDVHFLPQHFGCFRDLAPEKWDMVAPISDPSFAKALGKSLGNPNASMPQYHASSGGPALTISDKADALLKSVTESEYQALHLAL